MPSLSHTIKVIKGLNWKWAWRFYRKRLYMYGGYWWSTMRSQSFFTVNIDGAIVKLGFDTPYHHLFAKALSKGQHERVPLSMFKKTAEQVPTGAAIFDFGGYDGMYGLLAATVNRNAKVLIVEPDPVNVKQIEKNIVLSCLTNVQVMQTAIAATNGTVHFALHSGATAGKVEESGSLEVKSVTLSDCAAYVGTEPKLMKFDAVGAEHGALLKSGKNLSQTGISILLELYPRPEVEKQELWNFLADCGYEKVFLYPRADGGTEYYWVFKK